MCKTQRHKFFLGDTDEVGTIQGIWVLVGMIWRFNLATLSIEGAATAWNRKNDLATFYDFEVRTTVENC